MNASATLIVSDWKNTNDQLIIQDSDSGLEWLDLSVTTGMSILDVQADTELSGFRSATIAEVMDLFEISALDANWISTSSQHLSRVSFLIDNFRSTTWQPSLFSKPAISGRVDQNFDTTTATSTVFQIGYNTDATNYIAKSYGSSHGSSSSSTGNFLVRDSSVTVPEPTALSLLALGLFGIGFSRRRKS